MFLNIGLLSRCNLKCKFCFCKQDKPFDLHNIDQIPDKILQCIKENNINDNRYDIAIVGGEIFMDGLSDHVFERYDWLIENLQAKLSHHSPGCKFQLHCYSNGVYRKIDRVINFLKKWNSELVLSYDSVDRFTNDSQRKLMFENLDKFIEAEINVRPTVILLKPCEISVEFVESDIFKRLYDTTGIDYQICMPNIYNITEDDIIDFYVDCLRNRMFKIENIRSIVHAIAYGVVDHACKRSITYYENTVYIGCHYIKSDFINIKYKVMNKYNCLQCQYLQNCPGLCWVYGNTSSNNQCVNKPLFDFLYANPDIVEDYKKFYSELD